jgi:hypothetical protein
MAKTANDELFQKLRASERSAAARKAARTRVQAH